MAPENTLPGFEHAVRVEADAVELDLHASADGELVAIHDDTLQRTTDGQGEVEDLPLAALQEFDAGYRHTPDRGRSFPYRGTGLRIPSLDEALEAAAGLPAIVEVKTRRAGLALAKWLAGPGRTRKDRVIVGGFHPPDVAPAAEVAGRRCAYPNEVLWSLVMPSALGWVFGPSSRRRGRIPGHVEAAMVPERARGRRVVTPRGIARARKQGIGVYAWTVNNPDDMRRLFDWGVDGIISDTPGRVRRILDERAANT